MTDTITAILYWLGLAGAVAAVGVYFVQIAIRPRWVRLLSGAGLFFTGLGLAQAALALHALPSGGSQALGDALGILALLAAVYFQSAAALRGRRGERPGPAAAADEAQA